MSAIAGAAAVDDARRLLVANGHPPRQVVAVDRDSILYLDEHGRPRTAWLDRDEKNVRVSVVNGFDAVEPVALHPTPRTEPT